ncbi:MAG: sigma-54-dependent Fis family transcriptional regulator [Magnetococcales bacterium]|nr:sigma-54-dependent Fis family transcriptional regulator [Magnetococcales bacterium]
MVDAGSVLIVDDEAIAMRNLAHVMRKEGYRTTALDDGQEAVALLRRQTFDVVLTDLRMEGSDGMEVLRACKQRAPESEVILITGFATLESAVEAMREGAFFYIAKPFRLEEVRKVVREAMQKVHLRRENRDLREKLRRLQGDGSIITRDPGMLKLLETVRQVAPTGCNTLITGESGVGKELIARAIHQHGGRPEGPFVAVNCGVFSEDLLASELFGHEKGAFTGAMAAKVGLMEAARGGTLFLDELTEMSLSMQVKLLRAIQEREIMRVGGVRPIAIDVRFIAATNRNLAEAVSLGKFRQDLYFRLNVITLSIPPLKDRRGDIALLAEHFLKRGAERMERRVRAIAPEAMAILREYDYPGNIRELENVIERAVALCNEEVITPQHLPDELRIQVIRTFRGRGDRPPTLEELETDYIRWVLDETGGNQTMAAEILAIDRVSLWRKLKKLRMLSGEGDGGRESATVG